MHSKDFKVSSALETVLMDYAGLSLPLNSNSREVKQLSAAVKTISDEYITADDSFKGNLFKKQELRNAYLVYYLPANLIKLFPILDELFSHPEISGFNGSEVSILDLGCGPGTFLLGVLEYLAVKKNLLSRDIEQINLWGIDRIEECMTTAREVIKNYLQAQSFPLDIRWKLQFKAGSLSSTAFPHPLLPENKQFDLIIAGNVFAEIESAAYHQVVPVLEQLLSTHGTLILIDPGTRAASRNLINLRNMLLKQTALTLYAPCLERGLCPSLDNPKDWCHQKLFWSPPDFIKAIDRHTCFTKGIGVQYTYFTFRKDGKRVAHPFCDFPREKIWRVVSYLIKSKGEERLFVCNGKERILVRRLTKNASPKNRDFSQALRGDCVVIDGLVKREAFFEINKDSLFKGTRADSKA
jgi:ribosomal protein RSM22 (predicted rRNA methylase)